MCSSCFFKGISILLARYSSHQLNDSFLLLLKNRKKRKLRGKSFMLKSMKFNCLVSSNFFFFVCFSFSLFVTQRQEGHRCLYGNMIYPFHFISFSFSFFKINLTNNSCRQAKCTQNCTQKKKKKS